MGSQLFGGPDPVVVTVLTELSYATRLKRLHEVIIYSKCCVTFKKMLLSA